MDVKLISDDEVIASVLEGRTRDFEILISRYAGKIVHFITRMTGDPDEAQNIAQETFLKIYENLPYYKMENKFSAFIFKVARNLTFNWLKRQKRTVFFSHLLGRELDGIPFRQYQPVHSAPEQAERENSITRHLLLLPEEQRIALILKIYLEFSYKQIREITGWSIPKIETLISRAKSRLKKNIQLQEKRRDVVF
jgi:RNA polymerase sigma-70 factor (ECF subfamily)